MYVPNTCQGEQAIQNARQTRWNQGAFAGCFFLISGSMENSLECARIFWNVQENFW